MPAINAAGNLVSRNSRNLRGLLARRKNGDELCIDTGMFVLLVFKVRLKTNHKFVFYYLSKPAELEKVSPIKISGIIFSSTMQEHTI